MKIMKPNKEKKNIQDYSILSISHILYSTTHICLVLILFLISYYDYMQSKRFNFAILNGY